MRNCAVVVATGLFLVACARERPAPLPAGDTMPEDEFGARAAAVVKGCELTAVYVGLDDARAAATANDARKDALAAMRRAPDPYRGGVFARAYERLDDAATTLNAAGAYNHPLSVSECERLRAELTAAADELKPLADPYYRKLTRRYERPRPARIWGPLAGPITPPAGERTSPPRRPAPPAAEPEPASAGTASPSGPLIPQKR